MNNPLKLAFSLKFNKGYTDLSYLHLDITSRCNLKCKMCEWRYKVKPKDMPFWIFKKAIDEGIEIGVKKVLFSASGEALIHPDFPTMVDYVWSNGLKTELVTNLTIMNDRVFNALLKLDTLTVSIDGAFKKTYEKIRIGARFEETLENLKNISEAKSVRINYVIQRNNFKEVDWIIELAKKYEARHISYKLVQNTMGYNAGLQLNPEESTECQERLNIATKRMEKSGITWKVQNEQNPEIHGIPCYNLWFGTFVNPDGLVFPCCDFYREEDALGDLKTQTLKEIWKSEKYNEARKRFKGTKPEICELCPGNNMAVHEKLIKIPFHKILLGV